VWAAALGLQLRTDPRAVVGGCESHDRPFDFDRNLHGNYVDVLFVHIYPQPHKPGSHLGAVYRAMLETFPQTPVVIGVKMREKVVLEGRVLDCVVDIRHKSDNSRGNLRPAALESDPLKFAGRGEN
jgi:hypothetical protein